MWGALALWFLGQAKDPRVRRGAAWLGLAVILLSIANTAAIAVPLVRQARLTLAFLGGVSSAWFRAYNGSVYYTLEAPRALGRVAKLLAQGQQAAAEKAFDAWLATFDPLGLVRDKIDKKEIENDPTLFQEAPNK